LRDHMAKSVLIVIALAALLPQQALKSASPGPSSATTVYDQGKDIFVSGCAKCHDQDANKKLPDGTTLLLRLAKSKDPEARLGTRIANAQERNEVMLYVESLIARLHSFPTEMKAH